MRRFLLSLVAVSLAFACAPAPSRCDAAGFETFWAAFVTATAGDDITAVKRLVRFPLETRGPMDTDSIRQYSEDEFGPLWSQLLEADPGLRVEPETLREYILRLDTLPSDAIEASGTAARVADLVFACRDGAWQLTMAYTPE